MRLQTVYSTRLFDGFPMPQISALPAAARALLPPALQAQPQAYVRLGSTCPPAVEDACWRAFHTACEPLYKADRLGCILFQYHLSFQPSQANLEVCARGVVGRVEVGFWAGRGCVLA